MLQAQAIVGFSDDSRHQTLHIEDVRNEDGSETGRSFGRTRPSTSTGRGAGGGRGADGAGVESTHSVFKNLESQVHQLGISLETVSSHIAALAQLASLAANSGSHAFGGSGGGNGSATPRLGGNPRARPEVLETGDGKDTGLSSCTNRSASQCFLCWVVSLLVILLYFRCGPHCRRLAPVNRKPPQISTSCRHVSWHGQVMTPCGSRSFAARAAGWTVALHTFCDAVI